MRVVEKNYVAGAMFPVAQSFDRVLNAARGEITQKRISSAQRKEAQSWAAIRKRLRKQAIDDSLNVRAFPPAT